MIHTIFDWREDKEFGEDGWIMKNQPDFNISNGRGIAHDTLEHFPGKYGSLADEMLAFGSMVYMRAETGWFAQHTNLSNPADHLCSDLRQFILDVHYTDDRSIELAPKTYRLNDDTEEIISESFAKAIKECNDRRDEGDELYKSNDTTKAMAAFIRVGYRKASRRWSRHNDAYSVSYLFDRIAKTVDEKHKRGEFGDELHVKVNTRTLEYKTYVESPHFND